jgi:hypothetical protein
MRVLISVCALIVFISVFFIFLTADAMFRNGFDCMDQSGRTVCTFKGLTGAAAFGSFIIGFFVMMDIIAVYLVITNAS